MQIAKVVGDVVATRKDENLTGLKLLLLQPLTPEGEPVGRTLVAVDAAGAGVGERVFFVRGKEASFPLSDGSARRCRHCRHRRSLGSRVIDSCKSRA
jgi:microcompartment protein CcmK/EutM